jgi:hypothetical protein
MYTLWTFVCIGMVRCTKYWTVCMMVNLLDDSNFHRQTAVMSQVLDAAKSTWWAFLILFQELNVAMVIKEFNILMLKSPLNQERYKILLMIYQLSIGTVRCTKYWTVCMMVNLLDDSNFHRQTAVMTQLIEMIIQNPVFGIFCIISMLAHPTSQCLKPPFWISYQNKNPKICRGPSNEHSCTVWFESYL